MKRLLRLIMLTTFAIVLVNNVYAAVGLPTGVPTEGGVQPNQLTTATTAVNRIWGSVKLILQVVSLSIVIACGVRYMFASADQKGDIKKSLGYLALGCAIVFGTTLVLDFIMYVAGDLLGSGTISNKFNNLK